MKVFKSLTGDQYDTWEMAMISDLCYMIIMHAEKHHKGDVMEMFYIQSIIKEESIISGDITISIPMMVETEGKVVIHWIMDNLPLLEDMIAYYLDAKVKKEEGDGHKN